MSELCFAYLYLHLTVWSCHLTYVFQSEFTLCSCLNVKELLPWSSRKMWSWNDCNWTLTQNQLVLKRKLNHLGKLSKWSRCVLCSYLCSAFDSLCSCQVWYVFQNDSTLHRCLMSRNSLLKAGEKSEGKVTRNWIRTQSYFVLKRTLNHLAKLAKWWSCVLSTYLYGVFDCMVL